MPLGKTQIVTSGEVTTPSYVYGARIHTLNYAQVVVGVECLAGVSGGLYTIQGAPNPSAATIAITSGLVTSGEYAGITSGLWMHDNVRVGISDVHSGAHATITIHAIQRGVAV